ncbi:hypothetical protein IG631_21962 [Alternaria alternata]|nr:hypothetical protein IG631_21962 [Alternaria alternata]
MVLHCRALVAIGECCHYASNHNAQPRDTCSPTAIGMMHSQIRHTTESCYVSLAPLLRNERAQATSKCTAYSHGHIQAHLASISLTELNKMHGYTGLCLLLHPQLSANKPRAEPSCKQHIQLPKSVGSIGEAMWTV